MQERFFEALKSYTLCDTPVAFIANDSTQFVSKASFSVRYNFLTAQMNVATRYKDDAAKYAISLDPDRIKHVSGVCYRPGDTQRIVDNMANMWVKPPILSLEPLDEEPKMMLDHFAWLIPNEVERKLALDWLAHCIQKPMVKIMFALLFVDDKGGTGKSWIGYLMRVIHGIDNVLLIGKDDKVGDRFNLLFFNKSFVFIHEAMPNGKSDLVDTLKDKITENTIEIEKKGVDKFEAENHFNIAAATNHANALKILEANRRWAVVMGKTDTRYCGDEGQPTPESEAYYNKLFDETPNGPGLGTSAAPGDEARRVLAWAMERDLSKFNRSSAPMTEAKAHVADATKGNWASHLCGAKVDRAEPFVHELFTLQHVLDVLAKHFPNAQHANIRSPALSSALIEAGCRHLDKQAEGSGVRARLWTLSPGRAKTYNATAPADVARLYAEMLKPGSGSPSAGGYPAAEPLDEAAEEFAEPLDEPIEVTVMTTAEALDELADLM